MNIIIIGATSGIGRGLWKHYTEQGNQVAAVGRRTELLEQMREEQPQHTVIYAADVTDTDAIVACIDNIFTAFGQVDLAIVSAGTGDINAELAFDKEEPALRTNVLGWTAVVDSLYNHFCRQHRGHLVTLTSVGGLAAAPLAPAYAATKAYQINYSKALQKKSRRSGILVTEIRPGLVDTAMAKGEGLFWVMPVEKVVKQIIKAISAKKTTVVVTKRWRAVAFFLKLFGS